MPAVRVGVLRIHDTEDHEGVALDGCCAFTTGPSKLLIFFRYSLQKPGEDCREGVSWKIDQDSWRVTQGLPCLILER